MFVNVKSVVIWNNLKCLKAMKIGRQLIPKINKKRVFVKATSFFHNFIPKNVACWNAIQCVEGTKWQLRAHLWESKLTRKK